VVTHSSKFVCEKMLYDGVVYIIWIYDDMKMWWDGDGAQQRICAHTHNNNFHNINSSDY
jgi:hypothetical protein